MLDQGSHRPITRPSGPVVTVTSLLDDVRVSISTYDPSYGTAALKPDTSLPIIEAIPTKIQRYPVIGGGESCLPISYHPTEGL
jgi:hypothetical protein